MKKTLIAAVMLAVSSPAVFAQAPLVVGAAPTSPMLRTGTEVVLRTLVEVTTFKKTLMVGQRIPLEVASAVTINGQVVIPVGTPGMGEITMVRNKGMWGKSGAFTARVVSIRVGDREIRMTGEFDDKGHAGGGAAVATSALVFLPAGFFMTGTSARLPIGAPVNGFIGEDVPVTLAAASAPAPLQAVAPAPVAAVPAPASSVTLASGKG